MFPSVPDVFGIGCPVSRIVLNVSADGVEAFFVSGGMFVIVTLPGRGARSVAGLLDAFGGRFERTNDNTG